MLPSSWEPGFPHASLTHTHCLGVRDIIEDLEKPDRPTVALPLQIIKVGLEKGVLLLPLSLPAASLRVPSGHI